MGPLQDIRVIELATGDCVAAGGAVLADLGADVIRFEVTGTASDLAVRLHHRGKRSIAFVEHDVHAAVSCADVLITDLDTTRLGALGLSRKAAAERYPRLIHARMTPLGSDYAGPRVTEDAAFFTRAGATGLMMSERPFAFGAGQAGRSAAFSLTTGVLAAIRHRDVTGRAHAVESSLLAAGVYSVSNDVTIAQGSGRQPSSYFRTRPLNALGNSYRCADGRWLLLGVASASGASAWERFAGILDDVAWMNDPRFATPDARRENVTDLVAVLDDVFASHDLDEWARRLANAGLNWNPIAGVEEVLQDPQLSACGVFAGSAAGDVLATPVFIRGIEPTYDHRNLDVADLERLWPSQSLSTVARQADGRRPLDGIRVLDTSNYVAGPAVGSLLVDLGAEVIKVEVPSGDPRRVALTHRVDGDPSGLNRSYHMDNRGKRGISLNLREPDDLATLKRIAAGSDVFLTNLLPQRQRSFGLTADDLLDSNPRIVYVSLTAYGASGPDAELPGFDVTAFFARSGMLGLLTKQVSAPPRSRSGQGDHIATLVLMTGLLAAIRDRDRTGQGQVVDTSLLAVGAYAIGEDLLRGRLRLDPPMHGWQNAYYQCADAKWLQLAFGSLDEATSALPRLGVARAEDLEAAFAARNLAAWAQTLDALAVPWVPVQTLPEMLADPVVAATRTLSEIDLPDHGRIGIVGAPYRLADVEPVAYRPGPGIGEHTVEVLGNIDR